MPLRFPLIGSAPLTEQDTSGTKDSRDLWLCPKCRGPMVVALNSRLPFPEASATGSEEAKPFLKSFGSIDIIHATAVPAHPCDPLEAPRMWEDSRYCWVVLCKNHWFHVRKNLFFRHKILLAETDCFTPRPPVDCGFRVRCDECGKEYVYKPSEVLRSEEQPPEAFIPHPLFRDDGTGPHPVVADRPPDATGH